MWLIPVSIICGYSHSASVGSRGLADSGLVWQHPSLTSSRTSMSSRVPSASPLTLRDAAQNASSAFGQGARFGLEDLQMVVQLD